MAVGIGKFVMIRKFLMDGPNGRPVALQEIKDFKDGLSDGEKDKMAADAAEAMGYELHEDGKYYPVEVS